MSALMNLDVSDDNDNTVRVAVTMRVVLRWERQYPNRSMAQFGSGNVSAECLYELAYLAYAKQTGYNDTFDVFADSYDVTPVVEEVRAADPTVPAV